MGLKIGLLNDSFPPIIDGVANAVKAYADILSANGDEPVVITPKYPHVKDNYDYKIYRYGSLNTNKIFGYRTGNPFSPTTLSDLYTENFDLLHVHCPFASAVLASNTKQFYKSKLPIVLTYHTKFDIDIEKRISVPEFRYFIKKFVINNINKSDEVWVVSEGAGQNLKELGYKGKYIVMPNGTDYKKGRSPDSSVAKLRQIHNIDDDCLIFLFVGRMLWYKNIGLSLEALKMLRSDNVKFKFIMVGDGVDRFAIEEYTNELGLKNNVIFTGAIYDREKLREYYSLADMFLFPSTYDTSGLVVKEAAACDCPSLVVKDSCAAEGIEDGRTGYVCNENSGDLYTTIKDAINDCQHLKQVGENAGNYVYYSWEDSIRSARNRYDEVLYNYKNKKRRGFRL